MKSVIYLTHFINANFLDLINILQLGKVLTFVEAGQRAYGNFLDYLYKSVSQIISI